MSDHDQAFPAQLLAEYSDDDILNVVRACRQVLIDRIDQADAAGDGPRVNALCQNARYWLTPSTRW
jgi:hypothetical protein